MKVGWVVNAGVIAVFGAVAALEAAEASGSIGIGSKLERLLAWALAGPMVPFLVVCGALFLAAALNTRASMLAGPFLPLVACAVGAAAVAFPLMFVGVWAVPAWLVVVLLAFSYASVAFAWKRPRIGLAILGAFLWVSSLGLSLVGSFLFGGPWE